MSYCTKCGKQIPDDKKICEECEGKKKSFFKLEKTHTMFDDCAKEISPTCVEDCINQDKVTKNLWLWAHRIEVIGKTLLYLLIIFGLLISFSNSYIPDSTATVSSYSDDKAQALSVILFFTNMSTYILYAIIEYCSYHVIALLVGSLARIVQSNRTMARLAELNYRKSQVK